MASSRSIPSRSCSATRRSAIFTKARRTCSFKRLQSRFLVKALEAALLVVVAAALTLILYKDTLGYGFDYDDYHFIRPYSRAEVLAAFHGPWDATGIEVPFYRPLTVALYAARFH